MSVDVYTSGPNEPDAEGVTVEQRWQQWEAQSASLLAEGWQPSDRLPSSHQAIVVDLWPAACLKLGPVPVKKTQMGFHCRMNVPYLRSPFPAATVAEVFDLVYHTVGASPADRYQSHFQLPNDWFLERLAQVLGFSPAAFEAEWVLETLREGHPSAGGAA